MRALRLHSLADDRVLAVVAVGMLGSGVVAALVGFGGKEPVIATAGALAAGAALVVLVSSNWLGGLSIVALSLPLPAIYSAQGIRLSLAAPITALVLFCWALRWGLEGQSLRLGAFPVRATAALLGVFATATLLSQHPLVSLREFVNFVLLIAFFVATAGVLIEDSNRIVPLVRLLVAIAAVCGVLAVLESLTVLPGNFPRWGTPWNRAALGFGQPNALGLFLAVVLPLSVHRAVAARSSFDRLLARLAVAAITLGLFATFSRGSWLAVVAGASAFFLTGDRRLVLRIWLVTVGIAVVVDLLSGGMLRDTAVRTIGDWAIEQRAALMLAGLLMFLDHPVIGVGPGGFSKELDHYGARITQLNDYLDTPHNAYVQMAAEAGIIGLALFIAFLAALLRVFVRGVRDDLDPSPGLGSLPRALVWSFATICFAGFVVWPFAHGTGQVVALVAALGVAHAYSRGRPAEQRTTESPHLLGVARSAEAV